MSGYVGSRSQPERHRANNKSPAVGLPESAAAIGKRQSRPSACASRRFPIERRQMVDASALPGRMRRRSDRRSPDCSRIPERHSRPARPPHNPRRSSQDSPAPAVTSVSALVCACSRPRNVDVHDQSVETASAITRLLPPPRTNSGVPFAVLQRCARSTSSMVRARSSHRAAPPTPSVVSGASGSASTKAAQRLSQRQGAVLPGQRVPKVLPTVSTRGIPPNPRAPAGRREECRR